MKKFLLIKQPGKPVNVREVPMHFNPTITRGQVKILEADEEPSAQDVAALFDGSIQAPVPSFIANWRCKAVLRNMGLYDSVLAALNALPEPQKTIVTTAWNDGADIERNGATLHALAHQLGLSDDQVDDMFRQAATITL